MGWFGGRTLEQSRLERRIAGLGTPALHDWLEIAIAGLGRAAGDARRAGTADDPALVEIEDGAEVVRLVAAELRRRV